MSSYGGRLVPTPCTKRAKHGNVFCDIAQLTIISGGLRSPSVRGIFFLCLQVIILVCAILWGTLFLVALLLQYYVGTSFFAGDWVLVNAMALKVAIVSGNLGVGTTIQGDDRANLGLCLWCLSWTCLRPGCDLHFGQATWLHEYVACNVRFRVISLYSICILRKSCSCSDCNIPFPNEASFYKFACRISSLMGLEVKAIGQGPRSPVRGLGQLCRPLV